MLKYLSILMLLTGSAALAADSPFRDDLPKISWQVASEHYGEECIVYGTVVATKDIGSRCFLNFHPNFRENFTVVITQEHYGKFSENPESFYRDKTVRVVGKVIEFKGKPEIEVTGPEQIEFVTDPNPPVGESGGTTQHKPSGEKPATTTVPSPPQRTTTVTPPAANGTVRIASYNVLNLFDDYDDPYIENERLPGKEADELKLLAKQIRELNADIIAFEEVESRNVLQQFANDYLAEYGYEVVLIEGNSDRGIDVGLLSRLPIGRVVSHRHEDFTDANGNAMRFQRDLLQVGIEPKQGKPFDVYVVHLKSKYGGEEKSLPIRMGEAKQIRRHFDDVLKDDPQARFVICGDFNDTFESEPLKHIVGSGDMALKPLFDEIPEDQRITYNRRHLSMIDFILASPAMAKQYEAKSYRIFPGSVESTGSDHNPVVAAFKL